MGGGWTTACGTTVKFADAFGWTKEQFFSYYPRKSYAEAAWKYAGYGTVAMARGRARELGIKYGSVIIIRDIKTPDKRYIPLIVEDCYGPAKGVWYGRFHAYGSFDVAWSHAKKAHHATRLVEYCVVGFIDDLKYVAKNKVMNYKFEPKVFDV